MGCELILCGTNLHINHWHRWWLTDHLRSSDDALYRVFNVKKVTVWIINTWVKVEWRPEDQDSGWTQVTVMDTSSTSLSFVQSAYTFKLNLNKPAPSLWMINTALYLQSLCIVPSPCKAVSRILLFVPLTDRSISRSNRFHFRVAGWLYWTLLTLSGSVWLLPLYIT